MTVQPPDDELFVGQVVALLPLSHEQEAGIPDDADLRAALAGVEDREHGSPRRTRARTYSVVTYAPERGIFLLGSTEVEVSIRPLGVDTPLEAAVFRIASISGRSLRVTRAVTEPSATAD